MCAARWGGEYSRVRFGQGWGVSQGCDIPRVNSGRESARVHEECDGVGAGWVWSWFQGAGVDMVLRM